VSVLIMRRIRDGACEFIVNEEAQGITEYGAVLSFVAILVALAFGFYNGSLSNAMSKAFSSVVSQLENMSSAASTAS
jgi:Flp pilus assembly pilin Flp